MSQIQDSLVGIQQVCCTDGPAECVTTFPGSKDACSKDCRDIVVPFWETCGNNLKHGQMSMAEDLEEFYLACKLIPTCDFASMIEHQQTVQQVCCTGDNCRGSTTPIAISECTVQCGQVFEPFWNDCGTQINAMGVAGQMGDFYINCLETMYPPGSCSNTCDTEGTFHCRMQEINVACCGEQGECKAGEITPFDCSVECALGLLYAANFERSRVQGGAHPPPYARRSRDPRLRHSRYGDSHPLHNC